MPYVDDVFALIALLIIWTSTAWEVADVDAVYVAGCASHLDCLPWNFICTFSNAVDDEHPVTISSVRDLSVHLKEGDTFDPLLAQVSLGTITAPSF